jgi:hypothetical protein
LISIVGSVCGTLVVLLLVVWAVLVVRNKLAVRRFYRMYRGQHIFVGTRRHGWYDFLRNNVLPVLPPGVHVAWVERDTRDASLEDWSVVLRRVGAVGEKPFLLRVTTRAVAVVPLHDQLAALRANAARDEQIQEKVGQILAVVLERESSDDVHQLV